MSVRRSILTAAFVCVCGVAADARAEDLFAVAPSMNEIADSVAGVIADLCSSNASAPLSGDTSTEEFFAATPGSMAVSADDRTLALPFLCLGLIQGIPNVLPLTPPERP